MPPLPAYYKDVYKADTLVLYGVRGPMDFTNPQIKGDAPKGLAPQISLTSQRADGMLELKQTFEDRGAYFVKVKQKGKDGKIVEIMITAMETTRGTRTREMPGEFVKVFDATGKEKPADQLKTLLGKEKAPAAKKRAA